MRTLAWIVQLRKAELLLGALPAELELVVSATGLEELRLALDDLPGHGSESVESFRRRWPRVFGMTWRVDPGQLSSFQVCNLAAGSAGAQVGLIRRASGGSTPPPATKPSGAP